MKYNETIKKIHENSRKSTIEQIKDAIELIKSFEGENAIITANKIINNSDLSRAVLYKEHALKEWNCDLWEGKFGSSKRQQSKSNSKEFDELKNLVITLEKKNDKLELENKKCEDKFQKEKQRSEVYKMDIEDLKEKNKKLLAECQRLNSLLVFK